MSFPSYEVCELKVDGRTFTDWQTIMLKIDLGTLPSEFMVSTSEASPSANMIQSMQIKPGDRVEITLGGQLALTGFVNVRQAVMDSKRHGVQIQGRGLIQDFVDSSIDTSQIQNQFKNMTWENIVRKALAQHPLQMSTYGFGSDQTQQFADVMVQPGETGFNLADRLGRLRKIYLGEDERGNLIALTGPIGAGGSLVEGQNIREMRVNIADLTLFPRTVSLLAHNATDDTWGKAAAEVKAEQSTEGGRQNRVSIGLAPTGNVQDAKNHVAWEAQWNNSVTINALITVYGWLVNGTDGDLWRPYRWVKVKSAAAMLNQALFLKSVTYLQDTVAGTRTILELIRWPYQGTVSLDPSNQVSTTQPGDAGGLMAQPPFSFLPGVQ